MAQFLGLAPEITRDILTALIDDGREVTTEEYKAARNHALYPGPGEPPRLVAHTACRILAKTMTMFENFVALDGMMQRYAFG